MRNKYFITLIGANATGKSGIAGWLMDKYKESAKSVGTYKFREGRLGWTGGADPLNATNEERRQMLEQIWKTDADLVLTQGMIILSNLNMQFYKKLSQTYGRKVLVIHLFADIDKTLVERITFRSGGKPMNDKRHANLVAKSRGSVGASKYAKNIGHEVWDINVDDVKEYDILKKRLQEYLV